MNIHEDGERLTNDDGDPHRSVAVVTTHKAAHEPGQWKLEEQNMTTKTTERLKMSLKQRDFHLRMTIINSSDNNG